MNDVLLEEIFRLLEEATRLEKSGKHRIEAATKYYESCYLMRQIVVATESSSPQKKINNEENNNTDDRTIGSLSCHLFEAKIDHYTAIARKLYFDEGTVIERQRQTQRPQEQQQQIQQPATSVIISLLDDAVSVLTETPTTPLPSPVPVLGHQNHYHNNNNKGKPAGRRNLPYPTAPVVSSSENDPTHRSANQIHVTEMKQESQTTQQQQHRSSRWSRIIPKQALLAIERRIQLRANLGHSALSKAVDLDERSGNFQTRAAAIASYVEASELYLGAIKLGDEQATKLEGYAPGQPKTSSPPSSSSSKYLVRTMEDCSKTLRTKLKRLLVSALDRVETLKKEEEEQQRLRQNQNQYQRPRQEQNAPKSQASTISSSIYATPFVNRVTKSFHRSPLQKWLRAPWESNNIGREKEETSKKAGYQRRGQSPTTVVW